MKRGAIWVSAVLYIAVGTIIISLILASAMPLITKIKDRNSFVQAKNLMFTVDETIRTVAAEGPGSQRELSPFTINAGKITINDANETVMWYMDTPAQLLEPNIPIKEGSLTLYLRPTQVVGKSTASVSLSYRNTYDLRLVSQYKPPYFGTYSVIIRHTGNFTSSNMPMIEIKVV